MENDPETTNQQACFIVGPIGDRFAVRGSPERTAYEEALQMWEQVFEPVCANLALLPIRADKITETGEIPEQIFLYLRDAPVVIADVTRGNPNVMYELGLRHTRDLITVQIGEHGKLPFDVASIRTIQFKRTEGGLVEVRDELEEFLRVALDGRRTPVTATRVWGGPRTVGNEDISSAVEASNQPESELEVDEPGFIDVLAEGEDAIGGLADTLREATESVGVVGAAFTDAGAQVAESDEKKAGFAGRLLIAKQLASNLESPTAGLESAALDYESRVEKVDSMVRYLALRIGEERGDGEEANEFVTSVLGLVDAAEASEEGIRAMIGATHTTRRIARDLVPVSKRIESALNRFLGANATIAAWRDPLARALGSNG